MNDLPSVIISIRPEWCKNIATKKKRVEVRKTAPKEVPFKAYIYMTKSPRKDDFAIYSTAFPNESKRICFGKVIGHFICDRVGMFEIGEDGVSYNHYSDLIQSRLSISEMVDYAGDADTLKGWHISKLVIYNHPKDLSEFGLKRAPQSWCYVKSTT